MKFGPMRAREAFRGRKEGRRSESINKKEEKTVQSTSKQSDPIYTRHRHRNGLFSAVFIQMFKKLDGLIIEAQTAPPSAERLIILALI